jgi:hypothetical protein
MNSEPLAMLCGTGQLMQVCFTCWTDYCMLSPAQARYRRLGPWAGFPEGLTSTYMLDPSDPLFTDIGAAFVQVHM